MDGTTYIGENSDRLDQFGPIKINLIGRWSAIGFGDQVLHAFSLVMFMDSLITRFPKLFDIQHIDLYNFYGPLPHVDNIRKYDDKFCEQFYPYDLKGKVKVRPLRLYQLNVFKYLHDIKDAEVILGRNFPQHLNVMTKAQFNIPTFAKNENPIAVDDKKLIMEIIRLSRLPDVKRYGSVNIVLNCRILSTMEKRREFSHLYLDELHPDFPVDDYTKKLLTEIRDLKSKGLCAACLHYRLTDVTKIQQNDGDPTKNGKSVETCLGPQESTSYFNQKVKKWFADLKVKYTGGKIYIFTDDFKEAKKRYKKQLGDAPFEICFCDKRSLRTMFTESWQDYLVMRECNEHCGGISMFGLWVKSYGDFENEIVVQDHHVFSQSIANDIERIRQVKQGKEMFDMLKSQNIDINKLMSNH